jgi:hypothetical protein
MYSKEKQIPSKLIQNFKIIIIRSSKRRKIDSKIIKNLMLQLGPKFRAKYYNKKKLQKLIQSKATGNSQRKLLSKVNTEYTFRTTNQVPWSSLSAQ